MFTSDQEEELATQIRSQYICKGNIFTDADLRLLAIDAYYRWNPIDPESEVPDCKQATPVREGRRPVQQSAVDLRDMKGP
jgi:hypothetical protein